MTHVEAETRGRRAETLTALYFRLLGWRILARRFRSGRGSGAGEVDLIIRRGSVLAFVEVKARATVEAALLSLQPSQRRRIEKGAEAWLQQNPDYAALSLRFDVVVVPSHGRPHHLADAWRIGD